MSVINHGPPALQTEQGEEEAYLETVNEKQSISGSLTYLIKEEKKPL